MGRPLRGVRRETWRWAVLVLLAFLAGATTRARALALALPVQPVQPVLRVAALTNAGEVPAPIVPLYVEGVAVPGGCLVDTGSPLTLLDGQAAAGLPLVAVPNAGAYGLGGIGGGSVQAVPYVAKSAGNDVWGWDRLTVYVVPHFTWPCILGRDALAAAGGVAVQWRGAGDTRVRPVPPLADLVLLR